MEHLLALDKMWKNGTKNEGKTIRRVEVLLYPQDRFSQRRILERVDEINTEFETD